MISIKVLRLAMALFRFHLCDGAGFCEDPQGRDLADVDAAYREALRQVRRLMIDETIENRLNFASFVEVEDEAGRHLFTVTFKDALELDPRPRQIPE